MPKVPDYYDWGSRPTTQITPSVNYGPLADSARGLQETAQGLANAGATLTDMAAKQAEDTLRTNLAAADTLNADEQRKILNDPTNGFFNKKGRDALDAYDAVKQQLADLYQRNGQAFEDNPSAKADYAHIASVRMRSALDAIDEHVSQERNRWMDGTSKARLDSATNDAVANYTDPRMVNTALAIGKGEIMDMADRNGWSPEQTDAAIRDFQSNTHRAIISRFANESPGLAANYFNRVKGSLTAEDAVASDNVLKQAEAEAKARQAEAQAAWESDFTIALRRGEKSYADVEDAYKAGRISPSFRTTATLWLDTNLEKLQEHADNLQRVENAGAGGPLLDPTNADDRKALNEHYDAMVQQWKTLPAGEIVDRTVDYAATKGIVPERLKILVDGELRAGGPAQQVHAAETLEKLRLRNPELMKDFNAEAISRGNLIAQYVRYGASPEDAVTKADEASRLDKNVTEARDKDYLKAVTANQPKVSTIDVARSKLASEFDQGWFSAEPSVAADVAAEYDTIARDEYRKHGDLKAAQQTALDMVKRQWGVTRIGDGSPRLMKDAPEKYYGVPGLTPKENADWMQKQLVDEVQKGGLFSSDPTGRISLMAHPTATARDGMPLYAVVLTGEDGIPRVMTNDKGLPLAWRPDFASSGAAKDRATELTKNVDAAKQERAIRDAERQGRVKRGGKFGTGISVLPEVK